VPIDTRASLHAALDAGMTFIDTADVYGDGRSERIIRDVLRERGGERPIVATKAGRRLTLHVADGYTKANLEAFIDRIVQHQVADIDEMAVEDQSPHRLGHVTARLPAPARPEASSRASKRRMLIVIASSRPAMISHGSSGRS
jgi:aryl-alcohol dehydrogenase-like predicted oxidoreductase